MRMSLNLYCFREITHQFFGVGCALQRSWNEQGPGWEEPRHRLSSRDSAHTANHQQCYRGAGHHAAKGPILEVEQQTDLSKANPGWQQKTSLESEHKPWLDSMSDSDLPSPLQATLGAGISPVFPCHRQTVTWLSERKFSFFFTSRSLSMCLVSLYPLGSACRMFLSPATYSKLKKGKKRLCAVFI